jgi:hypothetical protein
MATEIAASILAGDTTLKIEKKFDGFPYKVWVDNHGLIF